MKDYSRDESKLKIKPVPKSFNPDSGDWLKEKEASEFLGITQHTLRSYRTINQGPPYIRYGKSGRIYYKLASLTDWKKHTISDKGGRPKGSKNKK